MALTKLFKYNMLTPDTVLPLADDDVIVSCGIQQGEIVVWAIRNQGQQPRTGKRVVAINTGNDVPTPYTRFIGTCTSENGIVWHVFECPQ